MKKRHERIQAIKSHAPEPLTREELDWIKGRGLDIDKLRESPCIMLSDPSPEDTELAQGVLNKLAAGKHLLLNFTDEPKDIEAVSRLSDSNVINKINLHTGGQAKEGATNIIDLGNGKPPTSSHID